MDECVKRNSNVRDYDSKSVVFLIFIMNGGCDGFFHFNTFFALMTMFMTTKAPMMPSNILG
jgi:hypothetical protein